MAIQELEKVAQDTEYQTDTLRAHSRYNVLADHIRNGKIKDEEIISSTDKLRDGVIAIIKDLNLDYPDLLKKEAIPQQVTVDSLMEGIERIGRNTSHSNHPQSHVTFNIQGNVGAINNENKGSIENKIDMGARQHTSIQIDIHLPMLQQLAEAEKSEGLLNEDEYEELMDILEEIKEEPKPETDKQAKKWKRWLGKALDAGRKFTGGRVENALDEGVKNWMNEGGLEQVGSWLGGM